MSKLKIKQNIMNKVKRVQHIALLAVFVIALGSVAFVSRASAGTLTHTSLLEVGGVSNATPMIAATGQQLSLAFTAASTAAGTITIDFGTAWTGASGAVAATPTTSTAGCQALTGATNVVPGTLSPTQLNAHAIQITGATSMTSGQSYCLNLSNASSAAVTNPTTGVYTVNIAVGADSNNVGLDILSSGGNAYSITGTIAPTFTMSLSGTTDTFASNLASGSVTLSTGITTTINTNAASGWFVWAADSNAGLHSTQAATTIGTVTTGSNHTMNSGGTGPGTMPMRLV